MIVADTNLIAYLLIDSHFGPAARTVHQVDSEWAVPRLWRSQFNNVLATYMRHGHLSVEDAKRLASAAIDVVHAEYEVPTSRVLESIDGSGCSAYDCEFIALAQDLAVKLVTNDQRVLSAFPDTAVSIEAFAQEPPPPAASAGE